MLNKEMNVLSAQFRRVLLDQPNATATQIVELIMGRLNRDEIVAMARAFVQNFVDSVRLAGRRTMRMCGVLAVPRRNGQRLGTWSNTTR